MRLRAGNGRIEADRLRSSSVDARTRNGSIRLDFSAPARRVFVRAGNGSATVLVPGGSGPYRVEVDAHNGATRVGVRTDPSAARSIVVQATNGAAVVRYPRR